jgi:hypothetical protein
MIVFGLAMAWLTATISSVMVKLQMFNLINKETTMLTVQEINKAIMFGNFTNEELISIGDAIKFNRAQLVKQVKRSVTIGSNVKFTSNRNGVTYAGTVEKIAIKYVTVRDSSTRGLWKVPASMLEVV